MQKRKIIKTVVAFALAAFMTGGVIGCGSNKSGTGPITVVWYPNESANDYVEVRNEYGRVIEEATGRKVVHRLTTDYVVTIEAIASGAADIAAVMGAVGYAEARKKNSAVDVLFVNSGPSGTLDDAVYFSWLSVNKADADKYKDGGSYSIDNIQGKKISFVSNSSTSGFRVPTSGIIGHFSKKDAWKNIGPDDMAEGGPRAFFSQVLFGGSHQGSAFNMLTGKADVAAFCDYLIMPYVNLVSGELNKVGSVYAVKSDAVAPFNTIPGREFVCISVVPVLNGPHAYNPKNMTAEEIQKIRTAFTSDEVANNPFFFGKKDSGHSWLFQKTDKERFVQTSDSWYDPLREIGK